MGYLLFIFYFLLLVFLVVKTPFVKKLAVPDWVIIALFALKVMVGMYYGWFFTKMPNYQQNADTWRMFYGSLEETRWLKSDFRGFIADLFTPRYKEDTSILDSSNSYWNDIKSVLVIKMMAIFNLLSGGRYYINVLFFAYVAFLGPVAISRLFVKYFPGKKWLVVAGVFLFPSTLLWCSGFHKEGLLLTVLGVAAWATDKLFTENATVGKVVLLICTLFISFLLRNALTAFFLLWAIPWWLATHFPTYRRQWFILTGAGFVVAFFLSAHIAFLPNLPQYITERQQEFLELSGESILPVTLLQPTLSGFAKAFPLSFANGFIQPLSTQARKLSYLPAAAEIVILLLLISNALVKKKKANSISDEKISHYAKAMQWFCICFATSTFLLIGYTIPFLGAIVRYKSIVWPFLLLPLVVHIPATSTKLLRKNK